MRDLRNPFRLQHSESIETDVEFLNLFEPAVLDILPPDASKGHPLFIRSAPGGGKTSLLRVFTPSILLTLLQHYDVDQYHEVFTKLKSIDVISEKKIQILAIMLSARRTFPSLDELGLTETRALRLFLALLDARILIGALRSALSANKLQYPESLKLVSIDALPDGPSIPGLDLPCNGVKARKWAENLEQTVCGSIDRLVPPDTLDIFGHDELHSLRILDAGALKIDKKPPAQRWLLLLDDVHKLTRGQRDNLRTTLIEQRSVTSIWISERLEALSRNEHLGNGALEGRDYMQIVYLEDGWRKRQFEHASMAIADRRVRIASDVTSGALPIDSFSAILEDNLDDSEYSRTFDAALSDVKKGVENLAKENPAYKVWLEKLTDNSGSREEELISWKVIEILIERDLRKSQQSFDFFIPQELEERNKSSVRTAAKLFLAKKFDLPYYYGPSCVANLGFNNVEQFLRFSGDLFEEALSTRLISGRSVLHPRRQEKLLLKACEARIMDLPRRAQNGRDVLDFLNAVCRYCEYETYRPNAPYAPGVTGIAISMSDRDKLLDPLFLKLKPIHARFAEMLSTALANNIFRANLDQRVKHGNYMVLYVNRLVCVKYHLPLQFGGFREKPLNVFIDWLNNGYKAPVSGELWV